MALSSVAFTFLSEGGYYFGDPRVPDGKYRFVVPEGVTELGYELIGAAGGDPRNEEVGPGAQVMGGGALGGRIAGTHEVVPGDECFFVPGQAGLSGGPSKKCGGHGGGQSHTEVPFQGNPSDILIRVAGGGGGTSWNANDNYYRLGGAGGSSSGQEGTWRSSSAFAGKGGGSSAGGAGGTSGTAGGLYAGGTYPDDGQSSGSTYNGGGRGGSLGNSALIGGGGAGRYGGGGGGATSSAAGAGIGGGGGGRNYTAQSYSGIIASSNQRGQAGHYTGSGLIRVYLDYGTPLTTVQYDQTEAVKVHEWTVPAGVTRIRARLYGASGGVHDGQFSVTDKSSGAYVEALLDVTPGEVLRLIPGQMGKSLLSDGSDASQYGATGGGGSTAVERRASNNAWGRYLVAAGGGGTGYGEGFGNARGGDGGATSSISGRGVSATAANRVDMRGSAASGYPGGGNADQSHVQQHRVVGSGGYPDGGDGGRIANPDSGLWRCGGGGGGGLARGGAGRVETYGAGGGGGGNSSLYFENSALTPNGDRCGAIDGFMTISEHKGHGIIEVYDASVAGGPDVVTMPGVGIPMQSFFEFQGDPLRVTGNTGNPPSTRKIAVDFGTASSTLSLAISKEKKRLTGVRFSMSSESDAMLPVKEDYDPITGAAQYRIVIVDMKGTPLIELESAVVEPIKWAINEMGDFGFTVPVNDSKIVDISVPDREVQVWRGGRMLWWGVIVRARGDEATVSFQCKTLEWYFTKRIIGHIPRVGVFEGSHLQFGVGVWRKGNLGGVGRLDARIDVNHALAGGRSMRLEHSNPDFINSDGSGASTEFVYQRHPLKVEESEPHYLPATFRAWVWIEEFNQSAQGNAGVVLQLQDRAIGHPNPRLVRGGEKKVYKTATVPISKETPRRRWIRMDATVNVPNDGKEYTLEGRIFVPKGTIFVDEADLFLDRSLDYQDVEQAIIMRDLIDHAQAPFWGKSDLRIEKQVRSTGVKRSRRYFHSERTVISDHLDEFSGLGDGMEWDIQCSPSRRVLRTYFPQKRRKSRYVLTLGQNVSSFSVDVDGEETANVVVIMANDVENNAREERSAEDLSLLDGIVMEKAYMATPNSPVASLNAQARRGLERYRKPVTIPTIKTNPAYVTEILNNVFTGDILPVSVRTGWFQTMTDYRVLDMTLDPSTEQFDITLMPEDNRVRVISGWEEGGWRYFHQAQSSVTSASNRSPKESNQGYSARDFDDSGWDIGRAGFGWVSSSNPTHQPKTTIPSKHELWMRKTIRCTEEMYVAVRCDAFAYVYVNGNLVADRVHLGQNFFDTKMVSPGVRVDDAFLDPSGNQVVAVHVQDRLQDFNEAGVPRSLYGDVKVQGVFNENHVEE